MDNALISASLGGQCNYQFIMSTTLISYNRDEEEEDLYLCGLMEMGVEMMMIVLLMAMPPASTPYLSGHSL